MTVEVRESLAEWDVINRDPTLCGVSKPLADAYNLSKGDEIRVWNKENGAIRHFQIYRISKESFDLDQMRVRLSLNGRMRFWSFYDTDSGSEEKLVESDEDPWNAFGGPEEIDNLKTWDGRSDNGNTLSSVSNVPDTFESRVQYMKGKEEAPKLVNVRQTLPEWEDITGWRERCAISKKLSNAMNIEVGDNILLRHADRRTRRVAPYTVERIFDSSEVGGADSYTIRLAYDGRKRLHNPNEDKAVFDSESVADNFPAWLALRNPVEKWRDRNEALEQGKSRCYNELEIKQQSNVIVTTPHSGGIEINTFDTAKKIVELLNCDWWNFSAHQYGGGTFNRWHITSADINTSYQGFKQIENKDWKHCISIHGYEGKVEGDPLLIGGRGPDELKRHIAWYLDQYLPNDRSYKLAIALESTEWSNYNGYREENFVNFLTENNEGGIQYELPRKCREEHWEETSKATARAMKTWMNPHKQNKSKNREVEP